MFLCTAVSLDKTRSDVADGDNGNIGCDINSPVP